MLKKFIITIIFLGQAHSLTKTNTYLSTRPEASMSIPGMAPWMHFIRYGIFEGRSPGCGISLEAFDNDPSIY